MLRGVCYRRVAVSLSQVERHQMAQTSPYEKISFIDGICKYIKRFNITLIKVKVTDIINSRCGIRFIKDCLVIYSDFLVVPNDAAPFLFYRERHTKL